MINTRIKNSVVRTGIKQINPNVRVSSFQTSGTTPATTIPAGTPMGLLLALTYAVAVTVGTASQGFGDYRPNVRITSY